MALNGISTATSSTVILTKIYRKGLKLAAAAAKRSSIGTYGYRTLNVVLGTHVAFVGTTTSTVVGSASPTVGRPWTTIPPSPVDQYGFFEQQLNGGTYLDFENSISGKDIKFICTNFNGVPAFGSYIKINGVLVAGDQRGLAPDGTDTTLAPFQMTRGHTIIVLNPSDGSMRSGWPRVYDTYGNPGICATMKTDLQGLAQGDIVAIGTYDATSCTQDLRDALTNYFGANTFANTWTSTRISQMFLGKRNSTI